MEPTKASQKSIRHQRIASFLKVHLALCTAALFAVAIENMLVSSRPDIIRVTSFLIVGLPLMATVGGFSVLRRNQYTEWILPGILGMDSILVLGQMFLEHGLESNWAATPALLIFMLPLFSDRREQVWGLAIFQISIYATLFLVRASGVWEYEVEFDQSYFISTGIGFCFFVVGAAVLAGRASVDVLNSQHQLQDEVSRATRALREAQDQLVQQEKMVGLGQLTAGIAHEINNPLTYVHTNVTNIERDVNDLLNAIDAYEGELLSQGRVEFVARIKEEHCLEAPREMLSELMVDAVQGLSRVQQIIHDLRTFVRLEEAEQQPLDLANDLDRALKFMGHKIGEKKIRIVRRYNSVPTLVGFPALLNQVFMNLLQNACDAVAEQGGCIEVSTDERGDEVIVEVVDNGPGVPEKLKSRIFDPFFTTKEVGSGTGLGLSLSFRIIQAHDGRLEIEDAAGGGACFRICLPKQNLKLIEDPVISMAPLNPAES